MNTPIALLVPMTLSSRCFLNRTRRDGCDTEENSDAASIGSGSSTISTHLPLLRCQVSVFSRIDTDVFTDVAIVISGDSDFATLGDSQTRKNPPGRVNGV